MAYAPASLVQLGRDWENAIGSAQFSGVVGDASHGYGYHLAANQLPTSDYSMKLEEDRVGIDRNAASAIDMTMNTSDMKLVTGRFYRSWQDPNDPRLNYTREAIGTLDGNNVIYMDTHYNTRGSSDASHLWHVHVGFKRRYATSPEAAKAVLSVVRGETVAQWQSGAAQPPTPPAPPTPPSTPSTGRVGGTMTRFLLMTTGSDQ